MTVELEELGDEEDLGVKSGTRNTSELPSEPELLDGCEIGIEEVFLNANSHTPQRKGRRYSWKNIGTHHLT